MAHVSPLNVEDGPFDKEVHDSPECEMVRTRRYRKHGKFVCIFVRKCVCGNYENRYRRGIYFDHHDINVKGVFIHFHRNCFNRRTEIRERRKIYILETHCSCHYEYEKFSKEI